MDWLQVSLTVSRSMIEAAEAVLENSGAMAITLTDSSDQPILEPPVGETPLWPSIELSGLYPGNTDPAQLIKDLLDCRITDRAECISVRFVEDQNWSRGWMDHFQPMRFGNKLWVYPGHVDPPESDDVVIRIDPGLAFGTGTHPTTALCLEWIDSADLGGKTVVDYGCGSGILAVAAALRNAARVLAVDNDPQALAATIENASRNKVSQRILTMEACDFDRKNYDVCVANILSGPLIGLAPRLGECIRVGGHLVLSGILEEQAGDVQKAYAKHIDWRNTRVKDTWVCMDGVKFDV